MSDIESTVLSTLRDARLPCAFAFHIAGEHGWTPSQVGAEADRLDVRISRCQLGLFGFEEFGEKRFTGCVAVIPSELRDALTRGSTSKAISCLSTWRIADDLAIPRILAGVAANEMGIRITQCQLGCFGSSAMSEL